MYSSNPLTNCVLGERTACFPGHRNPSKTGSTASHEEAAFCPPLIEKGGKNVHPDGVPPRLIIICKYSLLSIYQSHGSSQTTDIPKAIFGYQKTYLKYQWIEISGKVKNNKNWVENDILKRVL